MRKVIQLFRVPCPPSRRSPYILQISHSIQRSTVRHARWWPLHAARNWFPPHRHNPQQILLHLHHSLFDWLCTAVSPQLLNDHMSSQHQAVVAATMYWTRPMSHLLGKNLHAPHHHPASPSALPSLKTFCLKMPPHGPARQPAHQ